LIQFCFKEECTFIREIKPNDIIRITMHQDNSFENGSRWKIHHELINQKNEKVAHLTVHGAWLNLELRKLTDPPEELVKAFRDLPLTEDYVYGKSR